MPRIPLGDVVANNRGARFLGAEPLMRRNEAGTGQSSSVSFGHLLTLECGLGVRVAAGLDVIHIERQAGTGVHVAPGEIFEDGNLGGGGFQTRNCRDEPVAPSGRGKGFLFRVTNLCGSLSEKHQLWA